MRRFFGQYSASSGLALGILEATFIGVGCFATFYYFIFAATFPGIGATAQVLILPAGIVALMYSAGLYDPDAVLSLKRTLSRVAVLTAPIFLLSVWATGEMAKHTHIQIYPYRWQWTGALTGVWLLSAVLVRVIFQQVHRRGIFARRIVLVGTDGTALERIDIPMMRERCNIVAIVNMEAEGNVLGSPDALADSISRHGSAEVVIAVGSSSPPWNTLAHCRMSGIRVSDYLDFYERESRRICLEQLREDWIARSRGLRNSRLPFRRIADLLMAITGFVATAPVLFLAALAVKLEDGGPVFYRQERIGLGGKAFVLLKFRSMRLDAERDGRPTWAAERDSRITRVGRLIRLLRIDELPQLWNVLMGEMSVVGPRPERPYFVRQFSETIPYYDYRHAVRPGITGWAQVSYRYGASLDDARRKLSYDLYYIRNRGVLLDILILLKTVGVVVRGEGAR